MEFWSGFWSGMESDFELLSSFWDKILRLTDRFRDGVKWVRFWMEPVG